MSCTETIIVRLGMWKLFNYFLYTSPDINYEKNVNKRLITFVAVNVFFLRAAAMLNKLHAGNYY